ncbi:MULTISPECIES: type II toxin-antitoxin system HigB family toxin [unclassified Desulfovibrio]|uniref:type II toxin-antitoxin system HigB family toxin n=1 Tax=unclassified Desulfovibrio TaxID=2593640 RepID=UPI000F5E3A48|nr:MULTISPECIES: type II toxin-antitoxin system HigB family toxin [unclassified Desulfovibrio]RRD71022.1 type II toxin-antitoxin system HigB family toxin [Desulfovibrio sp. OH1209_COT-279]RRD87364.1 type II toxin-antitoxin system HigB family toxin [Desulfovibrio sp. OH1186_COT-070]
MRIVAVSTLKRFWENHAACTDAKAPLEAWYAFAGKADWASPADVKKDFGSASILKDGRVVFNIAGNKYRLVVRINYPYRVVYIRFIGTHVQYDAIDAQTI